MRRTWSHGPFEPIRTHPSVARMVLMGADLTEGSPDTGGLVHKLANQKSMLLSVIALFFLMSTSMIFAMDGALDGGSPMSHVDFMKWQCRMFLSLILPNVECKNRLRHYNYKPLTRDTKPYVACPFKNAHVALSILGVQSHMDCS